jgi:hypothetical protein
LDPSFTLASHAKDVVGTKKPTSKKENHVIVETSMTTIHAKEKQRKREKEILASLLREKLMHH